MLVKLSEPNLEGVTSRSAAYFSEVSAAVQAFRGAVEGATAISSQPMPACSLILIATSSSAPRAAGVTGEEAIVSVESGGQPNPRYDDPSFRLGFARLVTHYFSHAAWLSDSQLLAYTDRLVDIPGVLIHDQLDLGSPLRTAWQLAQAWPESQLVILPAAGHTSASLAHQVVAATDAFAAR